MDKIDKNKLKVVQSLDDTPTQTGEELKAMFDEDSQIIADYLNDTVVTQVNSNITNISKNTSNIATNTSNIKSLDNKLSNITSNDKETSLLRVEEFTSSTLTIGYHGVVSGDFTSKIKGITDNGYKLLGAIGFKVNAANDSTKVSNMFFYRVSTAGTFGVGSCEDGGKITVSITYLFMKTSI